MAQKIMEEKAMKTYQNRLNDLKSNTKLLSDACDRFIGKYDYDEIKNIGIRLRVIVGSGKGSGLLFELARETNDEFQIMTLNQYGLLKITEIDHESGKVVQEKEKKILFTKIPGRLPISFPIREDGQIYKITNLQEWIKNGFLLDWDVPQDGGDTETIRFTPQYLINRYVGQEAAHSDASYGIFGTPIEGITMEYTLKDKNIVVPIVYEYLYQIGRTVAEVANDYVNSHLQS